MKSHSTTVILILLVLVAVCFPNANKSYAFENPQAKPADEQSSEQEGIEIEDAELADWEAAKGEPDYDKRATKLLEFINKYPKTQLKKHFEYEYATLFDLCQKEEKWEALQSIIQKWLQAYPDYPNKLDLTARDAIAAEKLGNYERCAECLEEIYAQKPDNKLVLSIYESHKKTKKLNKMIEWADKVLQTPEYAGYYWIPYEFVQKYSESKNTKEAIVWIKKTFKAADAAKDLTPQQQEELTTVRNIGTLMIAQQLIEDQKWDPAIKALNDALKYKKSCTAFLNIGLAKWKQGKGDDAMDSLAKAELMNEESCSKEAKKHLETLYSSQHNDTLVGIKKLYDRTREDMEKDGILKK